MVKTRLWKKCEGWDGWVYIGWEGPAWVATLRVPPEGVRGYDVEITDYWGDLPDLSPEAWESLELAAVTVADMREGKEMEFYFPGE